METKVRRKNVSDAQIVVELIAGATTKEIINKLGMSMAGSTYKRIDKLRLENPVPEIEDLSGFDLNLLDTLKKDKERYRVIAIDERAFAVKSITPGRQQPIAVSKAAYLSGKSGFVKIEGVAPVTVYNVDNPPLESKKNVTGIAETVIEVPESVSKVPEIVSKSPEAVIKPKEAVSSVREALDQAERLVMLAKSFNLSPDVNCSIARVATDIVHVATLEYLNAEMKVAAVAE